MRLPTQRAGGSFDETSLPRDIVADALKSGDAALPMISNVMAELWREPDAAHRLRGAVYRRIGGVGGALAGRADEVVAEFSSDARQAVCEFFLALVRPGRDAADTRRVIDREAALAAASPDRALAERILTRFSGGLANAATRDRGLIRLVTLHTPTPPASEHTTPGTALATTVELAHEVLIGWRAECDAQGRRLAWWPTLRDWLDTHRATLETRELLTLRARRWHDAKRPNRGGLLAADQDLESFAQLGLATDSAEYHYVQASAAQQAAQSEEQRARVVEQDKLDKSLRKSRWIIKAVLSLVLGVMAMGGAMLGWNDLNDEQQWFVTTLPRRIAVFTAMHTFQKTLIPETREIPAGTFLMGFGADDKTGEADERPAHPVQVGAFGLGVTEVTFEEYDRFAVATHRTPPDDSSWGRGNRPVINVSWLEAQAYAVWLSGATGQAYRLPSEAEWEYAARGGTQTAYWWGDEIRRGGEVMANCAGCGSAWDGKQTAPVGSFASNGYGLKDMHGNVLEWVSDCYHASYQGAPADGRAWTEIEGGDCTLRVVRGGSWGSRPRGLRSADRFRNDSGGADSGLGFRLARTLR